MSLWDYGLFFFLVFSNLVENMKGGSVFFVIIFIIEVLFLFRIKEIFYCGVYGF